MLVTKFLCFRRKRLEKRTHIDNFLYLLYIFLYLKKKIRLLFEKKSKKILKIIFANFLFLKKKWVESWLIHRSKDRKLAVKMSVNLG